MDTVDPGGRRKRDANGAPAWFPSVPAARRCKFGRHARRRAHGQPGMAWTACTFAGKICLSANATRQIVSAAGARGREFCRLSDGALCFHAAPLADIGHVDQAIGADNGFAVHRRHSAATGWTFRARFSAAMNHVVVVAAVP